MSIVKEIAELETLYGDAGAASIRKVSKTITPEYRKWIDSSVFCALATVGPDGVDASPRGDIGKVVYEQDERTLLMPDWRGNNRMDSLRNIVSDGRLAVMLMTGGSNTVTRINGHGEVSIDPALTQKFEERGALPRSVIVIHIEEIYFQCARALKRSELWDVDTWPDLKTLPTAGDILQAMTNSEIDGSKYDHEWPVKAKDTMW